jgi:transposase
MHVIGEDRSQRLDVVPAQYLVIVTRRPKYACRSCLAVVLQAPASPRQIEGGLPSARMIAHVLVAGHADRCPLYRQAQILVRQRIEIDRATLAFWVGYAVAEAKPLRRSMREVCCARLSCSSTRPGHEARHRPISRNPRCLHTARRVAASLGGQVI